MTAMMMWQRPIARAPRASTGLRPSLSMYSIAGIVAMNMTMPTTPVARREIVLPERPRSLKIWWVGWS